MKFDHIVAYHITLGQLATFCLLRGNVACFCLRDYAIDVCHHLSKTLIISKKMRPVSMLAL